MPACARAHSDSATSAATSVRSSGLASGTYGSGAAVARRDDVDDAGTRRRAARRRPQPAFRAYALRDSARTASARSTRAAQRQRHRYAIAGSAAAQAIHTRAARVRAPGPLARLPCGPRDERDRRGGVRVAQPASRCDRRRMPPRRGARPRAARASAATHASGHTTSRPRERRARVAESASARARSPAAAPRRTTRGAASAARARARAPPRRCRRPTRATRCRSRARARQDARARSRRARHEPPRDAPREHQRRQRALAGAMRVAVAVGAPRRRERRERRSSSCRGSRVGEQRHRAARTPPQRERERGASACSSSANARASGCRCRHPIQYTAAASSAHHAEVQRGVDGERNRERREHDGQREERLREQREARLVAAAQRDATAPRRSRAIASALHATP